MGAMIFGTDATETPDTVTLPTDNDYWFTQGNGTTINGTDLPSYWANKVGAEIENAITASGQELSMTTRNQLALIFQGFTNAIAALRASVQTIPPQTGYQNEPEPAADTTYTFELGFTAPCAGYACASAHMQTNVHQVAGASLNTRVVLSGTGTAGATNTQDGTSGDAQGEFAKCFCDAGAEVLATFTVQTTSTPSTEFSQNGLLWFLPAGQT